MILPTKNEIFEFILTALLREIAKDGKIDMQEKDAINKLFPLLQISPARFLELKDQVQKETNVDYFAGSASYESMFAIIDNYSDRKLGLKQGTLLLARIAKNTRAIRSFAVIS